MEQNPSAATSAVDGAVDSAAASTVASTPRSTPWGNPEAVRREGSLRPFETQAKVCEQLALAYQAAPDLPAGDPAQDTETYLIYQSWRAATSMSLGMLVEATGLSVGQVRSALRKLVRTERVDSERNVAFGNGYWTGYSLMPRGGLLLEWAGRNGLVHENWQYAGLPGQLTRSAIWAGRYLDGPLTAPAPVPVKSNAKKPRTSMGVRRDA